MWFMSGSTDGQRFSNGLRFASSCKYLLLPLLDIDEHIVCYQPGTWILKWV